MTLNSDLKEYEEWEKDQNSFKNKITRNIKASSIVLGCLGFLIAAYLFQVQENNRIFWIIAIIIIVIIIWFSSRDVRQKEIIPEPVIKIICQRAMDKKIGFGKEFPSGTEIKVLPDARLRWNISELTSESTPFSWDVGVKVTYPDGLIKYYVCLFEPYKGIMTGMMEELSGVDMKKYPSILWKEKAFAVIDNTKEEQMPIKP